MEKINEKKTIQKRNIYSYICKSCLKKRSTLIYGRADIGLCTKCRRNQINLH